MNDCGWLDDQEMAAWRALLRSHAQLLAVLDRELRNEHGLSLAEYEVLAFLSSAPEHRLRMSELATRVLISPSALTRRLDRLVAKGWVGREACGEDARVTYAVLSATGQQQLVAAAPTHLRGVREHFLGRLSREQIMALTDALQELDQQPLEDSSPLASTAR